MDTKLITLPCSLVRTGKKDAKSIQVDMSSYTAQIFPFKIVCSQGFIQDFWLGGGGGGGMVCNHAHLIYHAPFFGKCLL